MTSNKSNGFKNSYENTKKILEGVCVCGALELGKYFLFFHIKNYDAIVFKLYSEFTTF